MKIERRMITGRVELRAADDAKTLAGYGAVFNTETVIAGCFREKVMPGAFAGVVKGDVRSLFNHNPNYVLGRTVAKTLALREDETGLYYEVNPPASRSDVIESVERGDVTGSSFGFVVKRDEWIRAANAGELPLRMIHEFEELLDVGPVTFPAYEETTAEARSAAAAAAAIPEPPVVDLSMNERQRRELDLLELEV